MSRSIHVTKRDLLRERRFAATDGMVQWQLQGATEIERDDMLKSLYKINEQWCREAARQKAPGHAKLRLAESGLARIVLRNSTSSGRA